MANVLGSGQITLVDLNDAQTLTSYITSSLPHFQMYNPDTGVFSPDWTGSELIITPELYISGTDQNVIGQAHSVSWYRNNTSTPVDFSDPTYEKVLSGGTDQALKINENLLENQDTVIFICKIVWNDEESGLYVPVKTHVEFGKVVNGERGPQGVEGPKGEDGSALYTWIRYADDDQGNGMSNLPSGKRYIGISYNQENPTESNDPLDYTWSKVEGDQGPEGPSGTDGQTTYTWIKYADDDTGSGLSNSPTNKEYIGIAYNNTSSTESLDPLDYTWSKIKGERGDTGPQGPTGVEGPQGPEGDQGIKGEPGEDGVSSYTHIAYANSSDGLTDFSLFDSNNKTYIGILVDQNPTSSSTPSDYNWSLIKGADGDQGIAGPKGDDGQTPYFHTAWSNDSAGTTGFSTTISEDKLYIGTYTDFNQDSSTDPASYNWTRIKGDKGDEGDRGPQGIEGPPGENGESLYTWIKYADDELGTNMTNSPDNKEYIGMAYNRTTHQESTTASDYNWTKIKGDEGVVGPKGDDGEPTYTWIKYADDQDGSGLSDNPEGKDYIGISYNNTSSAESTVASDYTWTKIKGDKGDKGDQGEQGPQGPEGVEGPQGPEGETLYTWVRYADNKQGDGISNFPDDKEYIGLAYNKATPTESNDPLDYTWSLIRGDQGNEGPKGDDGEPTYTWIKYADTPTSGMSDNPDGKPYMGIAYNKATSVESTDYIDYSWSLTRGEPGPQGPEGLQGVQGEQGIRGPEGADGESSYTHIAYANNSTGTANFSLSDSVDKLYIGMYVDNQASSSTDPAKYNWTLIKGADGEQGVEGPKGADGESSYLHIAYAYNSTGTNGFSLTESEGKAYIGTYTDTTQASSSDASKYNWSLIKGEKGDQGPQGIEGPQGPDGNTLYTWIKYADDDQGGGMDDSPVGKKYIGIAYNKEDSNESTLASDYTWSKIEGDTGPEGPNGQDGTERFTWIKYADTPTSGMSNSPDGKKYMGIAYNKTTATESTSYTDYSWSYIEGPQGPEGPRGLEGPQGPEGDQGIKGEKGADGQSSYTHVAYANNDTGTSGFSLSDSTNKTYIGIYVDFEQDSSLDPSLYNWTLIKGADGEEGIQGPTGDDGLTSYLHIAYANNSTGTSGFSLTDSENKLYIGTYTDFNQSSSTSASDYKWSLIKGDKGDKGDTGSTGPEGPQGVEGPQGPEGNTLYTWIKYADDDQGNGMDESPVGKKYIGIAYNKTVSTESNLASDYTWSKVEGEEGPTGPKGTDGTERFTWIKYADTPTSGMSNSPDEKKYLGIAYNKTTSTESTNYNDYSWSYIEGPKGEEGPRGLQGVQGDQGIQGPEGEDGISSYTHIAYANNSTGTSGFSLTDSVNKTYIGMYVDSIASSSTDPSVYNWTLIKGADGEQGVQGPTGDDGESSYLHIAYANNDTGTSGFSLTDSTDKIYIGTYTDNVQASSSDASLYAWTKIKGEKGDQGERGLRGLQGDEGEKGIKGDKGEDGLTSYTHIAYADSTDGTSNFSLSDPNRKYIGMYTDFTEASSTMPSDYNWSLIKGADGEQGIEGKPGDDGQPSYLHIAYANNSTGTSGFSLTVSEDKPYIGTYTDNVQASSSDPSNYKWTLVKGEKGDKGDTGARGPEGDQGLKGDPGKDGQSSYTHVAYANNSTGTSDFSLTESHDKLYIGIYVDFEQDSPTDPSLYNWTLIKGADGEKGFAGDPGEDGESSYLHIAYANNSTGTSGFSLTDSNNKLYIGTYTDNVQASSSDPAKYNWTLIKGEKGDKGDTGPRGPEGDQGLPGDPGEDGQSSYTHVAYANNSTGTSGFSLTDSIDKLYIGIYIDFNADSPTDPSLYNWTLIKGADGEKGTPGDPGEDGLTSYLHIAYANNSAGTSGFSLTDSTDKLYIGTYTDNVEASSTDPSRYSWVLIKGDKGDKGDKGEEGETYYTWIRYADSETGGGISSTPTDKEYIGLAYNKLSPTPSNNAADYSWSKIKGEGGPKGDPGEDGQTTYTWIKYADTDSGSGMSDSPTGKQYIGLAYNKTTPTESTTASDYTWSPLFNEQLKEDLNMTAPFPSYLEFDDRGITVTATGGDANRYVELGYRGLYISGGAIQIDGGLKKENIEDASKWDIQGTYIDAEGFYTGTLSANQVNAGELSADFITGGTISATDVNIVDLNASNIITGKMSAQYLEAKGLTVHNGTRNTFVIDSTGNVSIDGNITMRGGSITWGGSGVTPPSASEVGARPDTWTPTASEVGARPDTWTPSAGQVGAISSTFIGENNIWTGNLDANKITTGKMSADYLEAKGLTVHNGIRNTFVIDSNGDVVMDGNITMRGGSITWGGGGVAAPSPAEVGAETPTGASNKADAAESNAKLHTDVSSFGSYKIFNNPLGYSNSSSSVTGYMVIRTPIVTSYMTSINITGFNYSENNSEIDLSLTFYAYGSGHNRRTFTSAGNYEIETVQLGKDSGGRTVIIIGTSTTSWSYPKISVDKAKIGHNTPPDSYKDGWSALVTTDISAYNTISSVPGKNVNKSVGAVEAWRFGDTTEINGGTIRTNTITANQINVSELSAISADIGSITAGSIDAENMTITNITATSITTGTLNVGRIPNLNADKITAGTLHANRIGANTITGDKIIANQINANHIQTGSITADEIDVDTITIKTANIQDAAITDAKIDSFTFDKGQGGTLTLGGENNTFGRLIIMDDEPEGDVIADLDAEFGGFKKLHVGDFSADNVINTSTEDLTFYVDPEGGNDENTGLSWPQSVSRIQAIIDRLPKIINHHIKIYITFNQGTHTSNQSIRIEGFFGYGSISIQGNATRNRFNGYLLVYDTSLFVEFRKLRMNYLDRGDGVVGPAVIRRSTEVHFIDCDIYAQEQGYGVDVRGVCFVRTDNCVINDATTGGILSAYGATVELMNGCTGSNTRGLYAFAGYIVGTGEAPSGSLSNTSAVRGGQIFGSFTHSTGSSSEPPAAPTTETWHATSSDSWRDVYNSWRNTNDVYQGEWNGWGRNKGLWFFGSDMRDKLLGKSIQEVRIYARRLSTGGSTGSVPITFRVHSYSSRPSIEPLVSNTSHQSSFSWGTQKWVTLPSSFHSLLSNGSWRGIAIYTASRSNSEYAIFSGSLTIEVTYT